MVSEHSPDFPEYDGKTAPVWSLTVPAMVPVICAYAPTANRLVHMYSPNR